MSGPVRVSDRLRHLSDSPHRIISLLIVPHRHGLHRRPFPSPLSAYVSRLLLIIFPAKSLSSAESLVLISVRGKLGSPAQSQRANRRDRDFRIKVPPGTRVLERQILATQRDLDYHPGLNVSETGAASVFACLTGMAVLFSFAIVFLFLLPG